MARAKKEKKRKIGKAVKELLVWSWNMGIAEEMRDETEKGIARMISAGVGRGEDQEDSDLVADFINLRVTDEVIDCVWFPDKPEERTELLALVKSGLVGVKSLKTPHPPLCACLECMASGKRFS